MIPRILPPGAGPTHILMGMSQTIRLTGEDTGGLFAMVEECNPAGVGVPLHVHRNEDELFHVLEGELEFQVDGRIVRAPAGTTVFLPRNIPHAFRYVGEHENRVLISVFPAGCEKMFRELGMLSGEVPDMDEICRICSKYGVEFVPPALELPGSEEVMAGSSR